MEWRGGEKGEGKPLGLARDGEEWISKEEEVFRGVWDWPCDHVAALCSPVVGVCAAGATALAMFTSIAPSASLATNWDMHL